MSEESPEVEEKEEFGCWICDARMASRSLSLTSAAIQTQRRCWPTLRRPQRNARSETMARPDRTTHIYHKGNPICQGEIIQLSDPNQPKRSFPQRWKSVPLSEKTPICWLCLKESQRPKWSCPKPRRGLPLQLRASDACGLHGGECVLGAFHTGRCTTPKEVYDDV